MKKITKNLLCLSAAALILTSLSSPKLIRVNAISEDPINNEFSQQSTDENIFENNSQDDFDEQISIEDEQNLPQQTENEENTIENPTINSDYPAAKIIVYGGGKVSVTPDIAYVTIGVESVNSNLQQAIKENNDTIISIIEHLNSKNIAENDIKTKYYSVYQSRDYTTSEKFQEYHVRNTLEYKTSDLDDIGATISRLTELGANRVEDIQFDCSTISECYKNALKLALEDAKSKAASLTTKELAIDKITEECVYTCMPYRSVDSYTNSADSISSGNIEVEAKILVVFK